MLQTEQTADWRYSSALLMNNPVGEIALDYARLVQPIFAETSLSTAAQALRESGLDSLPVINSNGRVSVITHQAVRTALLEGQSQLNSIENLIEEHPLTVKPSTPIETVMRELSERSSSHSLVQDSDGRYAGMLYTLDLFSHRAVQARPKLVGGMATPFGVYLTNGVVNGGAKNFAIVLAGGYLSILFLVAVLGMLGLIAWIASASGGPSFLNLLQGDVREYDTLVGVLPSVAFLLLLRASPLAGTHAAEHMVVHAIERREPLTPEVVRRMPRVHPRCGTNFAVGAMLFMGIARLLPSELGLILALVTTLVTWRTVGGWVQYLFTTRPPNEKQIEGAIRAGSELIANYRKSDQLHPHILQQIFNTGMPWVLLGGASVSLAAYAVGWLLGYPIPLN